MTVPPIPNPNFSPLLLPRSLSLHFYQLLSLSLFFHFQVRALSLLSESSVFLFILNGREPKTPIHPHRNGKVHEEIEAYG